MYVATTQHLPAGKVIGQSFGLVQCRSAHYEDAAYAAFLEKARAMGANAILGFQAAHSYTQHVTIIRFYGTAVRLEDESKG